MHTMLPQDNHCAKERPPRLYVDAMLGRLARWLRLMGYDTLYWREGSDAALAERARAEGRLIITRDHQLAGRRAVQALLVSAETLDEQLAEVRSALGSSPEPLTRCPECNGVLGELAHADARELVPAYVWQTQPVFRRCAGCGRVYWKGTHVSGMLARLEGSS
jgi:uncharacterized protein